MPWRPTLLAAGLLAGFALVGAGLVAGVHVATRGRIAANERTTLVERLNAILPESRYDNDIARDTTAVIAPGRLGSGAPLTVYRARRNGRPVAAIMTVVAPNGYNGPLRLLVGVRHDGTLIGVRVISQSETPGLGDRIEAGKSDWLQQFPGRSLGDPRRSEWAVAKDGGSFDQLTGATITPRAVVEAIRNALLYFDRHRERLFRRESDPETS